MDLGADGWQTFRCVTLPVISTALVSGALLAFALSFDEVIVTLFTAGAQNTLPIWILGKIRLGQQLPEVNAVVFVVIVRDRDPGRDLATPRPRLGRPQVGRGATVWPGRDREVFDERDCFPAQELRRREVGATPPTAGR